MMQARGHVVGVTHAGPLLSYSLRVAPLLKALLVGALSRLSWQHQVTLARFVRSIWPGFRNA